MLGLSGVQNFGQGAGSVGFLPSGNGDEEDPLLCSICIGRIMNVVEEKLICCKNQTHPHKLHEDCAKKFAGVIQLGQEVPCPLKCGYNLEGVRGKSLEGILEGASTEEIEEVLASKAIKSFAILSAVTATFLTLIAKDETVPLMESALAVGGITLLGSNKIFCRTSNPVLLIGIAALASIGTAFGIVAGESQSSQFPEVIAAGVSSSFVALLVIISSLASSILRGEVLDRFEILRIIKGEGLAGKMLKIAEITAVTGSVAVLAQKRKEGVLVAIILAALVAEIAAFGEPQTKRFIAGVSAAAGTASALLGCTKFGDFKISMGWMAIAGLITELSASFLIKNSIRE